MGFLAGYLLYCILFKRLISSANHLLIRLIGGITMRKIGIACLLSSFVVLATLTPAMAMAKRPAEPLTMLVIPARYSIVQLAFDVARNFPVVLVSYQGDAKSKDPRLYAWNGKEWISITLDSYTKVDFVSVKPDRILLVGTDELLPPSLVSGSSWCPKVKEIKVLDNPSLVSNFGQAFNFTDADWRWFAQRYNLQIHNANAPCDGQSWYDGKLQTRTQFNGEVKYIYTPTTPQPERSPTNAPVTK